MKNLEGNIRKYYIYYCLMSINFIMPVIVIFLLSKEISLTEVMLLQSVYSVAILISEIPTGIIADVLGRKRSLIVGSGLQAAGCAIYVIGGSFYQFAMAESSWALGAAFVSGTSSALLYDTLLQLDKAKQYKRIQGTAQMCGLAASAAALLAGGYMTKISLGVPFYPTLLVLILSVLIASSFAEPKRAKVKTLRASLALIKRSGTLILKNPFVRWLTLYIVGFNSFLLISRWFYQPYMSNVGIEPSSFGIVYAAFTLLAALSAKFSYKFEKKVGSVLYLLLIFCLFAISSLLMSFIQIAFSVVFIFLQQSIRGACGPILGYYINKNTPSEFRATLISSENLLIRLLFAILSPFFGWLADVYTLEIAFLLSGITSTIYLILLIVTRQPYEK